MPTSGDADAARGPAPPRAAAGDTVDAEQYNKLWHELWGAGLQPGMHFDIGSSAPMLGRLLASGALGPMEGRSWLVPGCGRGYDALTAAEAGATAVGLDLSPAAVADAESHRDKAAPREVAQRVRFVAGDFFAYEDPSGRFDFGYDYTFL
ncbi:hypothetical protein MNEG_12439 [Monoraphidium neglectum]|uniref:Thiol methyltransferase 2 n=1 Tax=Monoraphidium neglectum TaxID=145388 RepID=A0A0D2M282_9CHLO|nr:hypothetical protein MNEG_12439 [Monoraphidium neglectum]KIY95521.1 hypothetical protein MNEG_12439 [Monoraphidium neglectum]|eukprot:XP_013894541.1 hypothetical protein MNEG_12439 [Monoraphidium neglectum]